MLANLKAEMARKNITNTMIANVLSTTNQTIINKLNEVSQFDRKEMFLIYNSFFSDIDFIYLFISDKENLKNNE